MCRTMKKSNILESVYKSELPSRAKQIMFYLINRANSEGTCFPSNKTIAKDCGISTRTVQRAIKVLLERGFIEKESRFREKGGQTSNLFVLHIGSDDNKKNKEQAKEVYEETPKNKPKEDTIKETIEEKEAAKNNVDIVMFSDYQQEMEMTEKEEHQKDAEYIDSNSATDKEKEIKRSIDEKNKQKKQVIRDDNLSNRSICHSIFYDLKNDSYFENQHIKTPTFLCHGEDVNLYPP